MLYSNSDIFVLYQMYNFFSLAKKDFDNAFLRKSSQYSLRNNNFAKPSETFHEIYENDKSACSYADEVSLINSFVNYKNMFALFNILSF